MNIQVEPELNDCIKLTKTTRGYTWEIKRYYRFGNSNWIDVIESIKKIDKRLRILYHDNTKAGKSDVATNKEVPK